MDETKVTTVDIFGREYKIRGFADEAYISKVAKYVDGKMRELAKNSSSISHDKLAILAALNIADELFRDKELTKENLAVVEQKSEELIQKIDDCLNTSI